LFTALPGPGLVLQVQQASALEQQALARVA